MSFFSKLFGNKSNDNEPTPQNTPQSTEENQEDNDSISFMLLFKEQPIFDKANVQQKLTETFQDRLQVKMLLADEKTLMMNGSIEQSDLTIACLTFPYPKQILDEILPICHFSESDKSTFHQSNAHVLLSIKKSDIPTLLLFDILYQLVNCLVDGQEDNVIGTVTEAALTAFPFQLIPNIWQERTNLLTEKAVPFWSWNAFTGVFVKYILDETTIWYVTKGNHQFGLPEFAYKGGYQEGNDTLLLFNSLFSYMYNYQAKVAPGHTMEIGDINLQFSKVTEYADLFMGKHGTLVVNKI